MSLQLCRALLPGRFIRLLTRTRWELKLKRFNCVQEKSTALGEALLNVVFLSLFLWCHFAFHFNDLLLQVVLMLTILWFYFVLLLFLIFTFAI